VSVFDLNGRIVIHEGASQFGICVRHALHEGRLNVVLNFDAVPYIDSTALGELVRASTTASQMGGGLKLLHVAGRILDLLATTKLLMLFEVFDEEADAVASFGAVGLH
jgi:anti-sigma B factor antagonist